MFTTESNKWQPVALPADISIGPGIPTAWAADDTIAMWTFAMPGNRPLEEGDTPEVSYRKFRISGVGTPATSVVADPDLDTSSPRNVQGSGASAAGLLFSSGEEIRLERVR